MQSSAYVLQAPGIPGDAFDASPRRALSLQIVPNTSNAATVGNFCTYVSAGSNASIVQPGGTGTFAGLVVNGKEYVRQSLGATNTVSSGAIVAVADMGRYWVKVENAVTVGDVVAFDSATGAVFGYATADSAASGGKVVVSNAKFTAVNATSGTMAVVELN